MMFSYPEIISQRIGCPVLLMASLSILCAACGDSSEDPVADFPPLTAVADSGGTESSSPETDSEFVKIYLDISVPMGGFLPPRSSSDSSPFQVLGRNVANYMAHAYGVKSVQWFGVGRELLPLDAPLPFDKGLFDGRQSKLDLAIEDAIQNLDDGDSEAVALLSDLEATGAVSGSLALGLNPTLSAWLESGAVRRGVFHVGLFGIKADYWGAATNAPNAPTGCTSDDPLGCRFDELNQQWIELQEKAFIPVYVLVLGRGRQNVESIMNSLSDTVNQLNEGRSRNYETHWELLTGCPRAEVSCHARARDDETRSQYALHENDQGQHLCRRPDAIKLVCNVAEGFIPQTARAVWDATDLPPLSVHVEDRKLEFEFDCSDFHPDPLSGDLRIEMTGRNSAWGDSWSTKTNEVGKTLELDAFVETIRFDPDDCKLLTPPLLRFQG